MILIVDDMDIEADEEDEDDEMEVEIDEEAEEEHLAPAYPVVVALPATAPSAEETEPFETDESAATPPPHPAYRMTARITIPEPLPVPAWSDSEVARLLAISSPPASPLSPWSSSPPQIPFPLSPPSPVLTAPPPSPIRSLGYRAATIRMRAEAAATSHSLPLPPPFILSPTRPDAPPPLPTSAPTSFPPLLLPSDRQREDRPEVNLPPRMGLGIALGPRSDVYPKRDLCRIRDSRIHWMRFFRTLQELQLVPDTDLVESICYLEHLTWTYHHTRQLKETEAGECLRGRGRAMDASDLAHGEVISLRTTVHAQMSEITELQSADHRRQRAISDLLETDRRRREEMRELRAADRTRQQQLIQTLTAMQTLQRETIPLQGLVTTLQGQVTALQGQVMTLQGQVTALQGQQGPAGGPAPPELPEEAGVQCRTGPHRDATRNGSDSIHRERVVRDLKLVAKRLALLCVRMFPEEADKIERYVSGLPDMIHGNIVASKPKTMQEAIEMATELMDKRVSTIADRQLGNDKCSSKGVGGWKSGVNPTTSMRWKGFPIFLAHVTTKEIEDKSEKKRLEDVPIVQDFPEVFPEDLPGLPPTRQMCAKPYLDTFEIVFIDEILIYSNHKQEHEEHLKIILELLKKEELYAKFSKCEFWIPKVQFLGHVIDSEGIHVDPAKIESIKDWASPKSPTEIRQFLGLAGYYEDLLNSFQRFAKPMTKLTQKKCQSLHYLKEAKTSSHTANASKEGVWALVDATERRFATHFRQKELNMRHADVRVAKVITIGDILITRGKQMSLLMLNRKEREPPAKVRALL
ncbi:putative reverse transcriptase domain-containing protein [Tanacetum coccineum]|uniref:Reverse transcriptase domain-containing protein n=1 Tax=Tanacetum coccineum TaxID=301880 RepID=A0ABQ5CC61_9ASTR